MLWEGGVQRERKQIRWVTGPPVHCSQSACCAGKAASHAHPAHPCMPPPLAAPLRLCIRRVPRLPSELRPDALKMGSPQTYLTSRSLRILGHGSMGPADVVATEQLLRASHSIWIGAITLAAVHGPDTDAPQTPTALLRPYAADWMRMTLPVGQDSVIPVFSHTVAPGHGRAERSGRGGGWARRTCFTPTSKA